MAIEERASVLTLRPTADSRRSEVVDRLLSFGDDPSDEPATRSLKRLVVGAMWISLVPTAAHAALMFENAAPLAGWLSLGAGLAVLTTLAIVRLRKSTWPSAFHGLIAANYAVVFSIVVLFGGHGPSGTNAIWGMAGILAALVVFPQRRSAAAWLIVYAVLAISSALVSADIEPRYELADPEVISGFNISIVAAFVSVVLLFFIRQRSDLLEVSDRLLQNVLPKDIAERLKRSGDEISDHFDHASILFADIVGFTPISAEMSPEETVNLLNEVFTAFDMMVQTRGLEKIKTVGDEYMVAAGVPKPRPDHAEALAELALAMNHHIESSPIAGKHLKLRIGINSGPVVAGIIGRERFSYDLWGDTVNTASRMESHGQPGRIQISETTYQLLPEDFRCEQRGTIEIKGKGLVPVWHLLERIRQVQDR